LLSQPSRPAVTEDAKHAALVQQVQTATDETFREQEAIFNAEAARSQDADNKSAHQSYLAAAQARRAAKAALKEQKDAEKKEKNVSTIHSHCISYSYTS
jgi:hypothetical protein